MSLDSFFVGSTDGWTLLTTAGLACVTVIARSFFFITDKDWSLPAWAQRGLQYAPIAALSAVIVPEIVMSQGQIIHTLKDARLYAVAAGLAFFVWRRGAGQAVLGTIASGMAVYLPLHIGLGW
ncbi:branched-chain amino acid transporter [Rhodoferax sp. TH121]|uniref:AzlD domain-containing protein n=1 Tax=Rhodoferax sp. TH121 TaxID=2022803 RepID=UPI000B968EA0|nr:AzlD domain-containing protein [Rhodoferax sp. TH121]OYQ38815.1 branched-chain amino acid transporter [Rhodoferax sp. TH121]